ncbi:lipid-A-disaccharide synthase [Thioalkalivibrio sp. XN279]|nr:lipid-A-disaccharide synthase [Thioalkalivibrio sp. XN279]
MRIGLVAGEASGDLLGAGLARALLRRYPDARLEGIAGPAMQAAGVRSWAPMEQLSVMGLAEVLRHLPGLLALRRGLLGAFERFRPHVVVGIDAPDFNLGLERRLRARGVRTMHYVSPSIWAWRPGRVHAIARAVDEVLCLLPFEPELYAAHGVAARFVGHPMADDIPLQPNHAAARLELGVDQAGQGPLVALLPGSRHGEVERVGGLLAAAAGLLAARRPGIRFIAAMASPSLRARFGAQLAAHAPGVEVRLVEGRSRTVMAAADIVLLASGTATLEAALLKRPMVVAYRVAPLTAGIVRGLRLMKTERFALPNLLAGEMLVPELIQDAATPERIAGEAEALLDDAPRRARLEARFTDLHQLLRRDADRQAAEAVLAMAGRWPPTAPETSP